MSLPFRLHFLPFAAPVRRPTPRINAIDEHCVFCSAYQNFV
jgi:hypothetical protein